MYLQFVATPTPGKFSVLADNLSIATVQLNADPDLNTLQSERPLAVPETAAILGFMGLGND